MIFIVGSGPAGISAAVTLTAAGLPVTLLDGGIRLEEDKRAKLETLKAQPPAEWDRAFLDSFSSRVVSDKKGVQIKYAYGSDFPYAEVAELLPTKAYNTGHLTPTLAAGGFSHVWGAAVLPFTAKEISDWPVSLADLEPHYRSVFSFLPLSARSDDLEVLYPLYGAPRGHLKPSAQAEKIFTRLEANRGGLKERGLHFGLPRLAVDAAGCVYSGMCLYGCPRGVIYSCDRTLDLLRRAPSFNYLPETIVRKITEGPSGVTIHAVNRRTKLPEVLTGEAVFLGAGVLSTAKILLESFPDLPPRELKVSEYFLLPLLQSARERGVQTESLHTLSQLFLECLDPEISAQSIHMQVYTYSDLFDRALTNMLRILGPLGNAAKPLLLERLLAMQGYLHSDVSSRIALSLEGGALRLEGKKNPAGEKIIRRLGRKLWGERKNLGFTPLLPQLTVGPPGEGRHAGGSFPMSARPGPGETDRSGKLFSTERVHIVDSSVFPSIPASTITLTVMANAQRIAQSYAENRKTDVTEQEMLHHG